MYLEIDEGFPGHRKTLRLCAALKNPEAAWYVVRLWTWACRSCPTGDLTGMDPYDIEIAVQYRQLDGACYAALVAAGFIDELDGRPSAIHDWMERTGGAIARMADAASRKKEYRAHKDGRCEAGCRFCASASTDSPQDITGTGNGTSAGHSATDKTSQDQSSPAQKEDSPPAGARDPGGAGTEPQLWPAGGWFRRFGIAWTERYQLTYGGGESTAKACASLGDVLSTVPAPERIAAQAKASEMLAAYFSDPGPNNAKHPFPWFVERWNGLRVNPQRWTPAARGSPRARDQRVGHKRAEDFQHVTGEVELK